MKVGDKIVNIWSLALRDDVIYKILEVQDEPPLEHCWLTVVDHKENKYRHILSYNTRLATDEDYVKFIKLRLENKL